MTRWPSKLLLLLSVAAALQLLPQLLALCVGAGAATGGYGNDSNSVELYPATVPPHKTALVIGYLTAIKGYIKDRQGLSISGALTMALDEVSFVCCAVLCWPYTFKCHDELRPFSRSTMTATCCPMYCCKCAGMTRAATLCWRRAP